MYRWKGHREKPWAWARREQHPARAGRCADAPIFSEARSSVEGEEGKREGLAGEQQSRGPRGGWYDRWIRKDPEPGRPASRLHESEGGSWTRPGLWWGRKR